MIENNGNSGAIIQLGPQIHPKPSENRLTSTPMVIIVSVIINGMLLMGLPFLTKIQKPPRQTEEYPQSFIAHPKQVKPLELKEDTRSVTPMLPPTLRNTRSEMPKPEIDIGNIDLDINRSLAGAIRISLPSSRPRISPIEITRPMNLDEVDRRPQLIRHLSPLYPFAAKRKGIQGQVIVRIIVDKMGNVRDPEVIEATPEGVFEESAISAVRRWRFKPAIKDKRSVSVYVIVPVKFEVAK